MVVKRGRPRPSIAAAKQAFAEVFGDPYAEPEQRVGQYQTYKGRGLIQAMKNNFDEGKATRNPASPIAMDFFCDVDRVVSDTLTEDERERFIDVYIEESDEHSLNKQQRTDIEQRIGRVLREKGVSPVRKYFTTVRRSLR